MGKKRDDGHRVFTRDVLVKLDDAGARLLLRESVKADARADDLEEKLAEHKATEKAKIAALRSEAMRKRIGADAGEYMVPMKVYEEWDGAHAVVYSAESGAEVDRRALTAEERQVDAFPGLDDGGVLDADDGAVPEPVVDERPKRGRRARGDAS